MQEKSLKDLKESSILLGSWSQDIRSYRTNSSSHMFCIRVKLSQTHSISYLRVTSSEKTTSCRVQNENHKNSNIFLSCRFLIHLWLNNSTEQQLDKCFIWFTLIVSCFFNYFISQIHWRFHYLFFFLVHLLSVLCYLPQNSFFSSGQWSIPLSSVLSSIFFID